MSGVPVGLAMEVGVHSSQLDACVMSGISRFSVMWSSQVVPLRTNPASLFYVLERKR
jgi:hypothetical protein